MLDDIRALTSYDVVLASGSAEAAGLSRELALSGGALSCSVCSASSWVERLWELAGDGRRFVDGVTRVVAMGIALEGREGLEGPHLPALLSQRMRDAAGTPELDAALRAVRAGEAPSGLLPSEVEVLRALAAYEDKLDALGLVEEGSASAYLSRHLGEVFPRRLRVAVVGSAPLAPQLQALLEAGVAAEFLEVSYFGQESVELMAPAEGVALRFAFPAGRYATPQLVLKTIVELADQGPILISSRAPAKLYELLEPALAARGFSVAMRGNVPLAGTLLGRLVLSLARVFESSELPWDKAALIDALANPLVHVDTRTRCAFDKALRADSLIGRSDAFKRAPAYECLAPLAACIMNPTPETLAQAREALARQVLLPAAQRNELNAVIDVIASIIRAYVALNIPLSSLGSLFGGPLGNSSVCVRFANAKLAPGQQADVLIEGMAQAATEPRGSFATVIVLDLDAESYPAARKSGAIDLLMDRLGIPAPETPIERQRRQLASLAKSPTNTLVLGRCLTNAKADPSYPAAVLEEFVDLYREDVTLSDDIDNIYALPKSLQTGLITCGEDALEADVWLGMPSDGVHEASEPPIISLTSVSQERNEYLYNHDLPPMIGTNPILSLSAGQIEAFLDCPAKWLYSSRLGVNGLDEEIGPRELGIFRHDSLQRFYLLFRAAGQQKVCPENLEMAKTILKQAMAEVGEEYLAFDAEGHPQRALDRCVAPENSSDRRTIERVQRELLEWLPFEMAFLPGPATGEGTSPSAYVPRAFELSLDDYDVLFAGARLKGRIDRVDVSLDGSSFVVVDYKGRLGANYTPELQGCELILPAKLQALIYAAAIARTPALQEHLGITRGGTEAIAGAVYVSYLRGHAIRGVFTERLTRERHLPTLPKKSKPISDTDMAALIRAIEKTVADEVVWPILLHDIDPMPLKDACTYCPAEGCPRKGWADAS